MLMDPMDIFKAFEKILFMSSPPSTFGYTGHKPSIKNRFSQLLRGVYGIFHLVRSPNSSTITGTEFSHLQGKIKILHPGKLGSTIITVLKGKALIVLPNTNYDKNPLFLFCDEMGIDRTNHLEALIGMNSIMIIFAHKKKQEVVIHFPIRTEGCHAADRHYLGLKNCCVDFKNTKLAELLPIPLGSISKSTFSATIQTRLPGQTEELKTLAEDSFFTRINLALDATMIMHEKGKYLKFGPDQPFLNKEIYLLPDQLPQKLKMKVIPTISALKAWEARYTLPAVPVHGDFWMMNILFTDSPLKISAIIDWEWYRQDGLPLLDALQLVIMSYSAHKNISFCTVLSQVWQEHKRESWLEKYLESLSHRTNISRLNIEYIGLVLWLETLWRGYVKTKPDSPFWLTNIINEPIEAIDSWLRLKHDH